MKPHRPSRALRWVARIAGFATFLAVVLAPGPELAGAVATAAEGPVEREAASAPPAEDRSMAEAKQAVRLRQFERAISLWEAAARRGNPAAAYHLGVAHRAGRGVPQDIAKAVGWFEKGAAGGDPDAQLALGILCESGLGVPRDPDRALDLIGKSARAGNRQAVAALTRIRRSGSIAYSTAHPRVALHRKDARAALHQAIRLDDLRAAREAIARGAPVDGVPADGETPRPLVLAIESGRPEIVSLLLENRADPALPSPAGEPPLILAVRSRDPRLVRMLLEAGALPASRSRSGMTALMEAARSGESASVDSLVAAGANPRETLEDGSSAADLARRSGFAALARRLQQSGAPLRDGAAPIARPVPASADGSRAGRGSLPPLIEAARRGDAALLRKLLAEGHAPDVRDAEGDLALHRAADGGFDDCVRSLLDAGVDVDARGHDDSTALMRALASTASSADRVTETLLARGADPAARDGSGASAFHHGARGASPDKLRRLKQAGATWTDRDAAETLERAVVVAPRPVLEALIEVVPSRADRMAALCAAIAVESDDAFDLLVRAGVELDRDCGDGRSPLMIAVQTARRDRVKRLLASGASPEYSASNDDTPLIAAATRGQVEIVSDLIAAGARVDRRGAHRATALMAAASNGRLEVARALLAAEADPRMRSETDQTAVDLATAAGYPEIAELIRGSRPGWAGWLGRPASPR